MNCSEDRLKEDIGEALNFVEVIPNLWVRSPKYKIGDRVTIKEAGLLITCQVQGVIFEPLKETYSYILADLSTFYDRDEYQIIEDETK